MSTTNISTIIFTTTLEVRISDINYGNHLGHDSLISLLHEARIRFLRSLGYTELNIAGMGILITNLNVNYLSEAFYADNITINISIGTISRTSVQLLYNVTNQDTKKIIAEASTTMTLYDYHKSKVSRVPQEFIKAIEVLNHSSSRKE